MPYFRENLVLVTPLKRRRCVFRYEKKRMKTAKSANGCRDGLPENSVMK